MNSKGCCDPFDLIDFKKMDVFGIYIDWYDPDLWIVIALNVLIPLSSITVAYFEKTRQKLTTWMGNPKYAHIAYSVGIVLLTLHSNLTFGRLVRMQKPWNILQDNRALLLGYSMLIGGTIVLYKAIRAIGLRGTFYGNCFGLPVDRYVVDFPYNFLAHPMFVGSTLNHAGFAVIFASQAGFLVTLCTALAYAAMVKYEKFLGLDFNPVVVKTETYEERSYVRTRIDRKVVVS